MFADKTKKPLTQKQLSERIAKMKQKEADLTAQRGALQIERKELEIQLRELKAAGKISKPTTDRNGDDDED